MRFFFVFLTVLLLSPSGMIHAQESIDIEALSERVSGMDAERLLMRLNTPIPAEMLPQGFSEPRPMNAEALIQQRDTFDEAFDTISGSAVYSLAYAPQTPSSTPQPTDAAPQGSPVVRSPRPLFTSSTLTYLLFAQPVDTSDQDAFAAMIQEAMGSEAESGTVEYITLNDAPAVLITSDAVVNAIEMRTQWIAVPVGNVIMVSMVLASIETFGEDALLADNEALALAGIAYLDEVSSE